MNDIPILFPIFVVAIIVIAVYAAKAAKQRREALKALAAEMGLRFDPNKKPASPREYGMFELFDRGSSRRRYNTLEGDFTFAGHRLYARLGDYQYKTSSGTGKNRRTHTHSHSYLLIELPQETPEIQVRPENFLDRIAAAAGFNDLDFESVEFSDAFHVKSSDDRFAYALFHPRMMELLLRERPPCLQMTGGLLLISGGGTWKVEQFRPQIEFVRQFVEHWPRHLLAA